MTEVCYEPERHRLSLEGHAGAGPLGEDLVCAGLSALWMALERMITADRVTVRTFQPMIRYGAGLRSIECCPDEEMEGACRAAIRTVAEGLRWMSEEFPEFVSFEEK